MTRVFAAAVALLATLSLTLMAKAHPVLHYPLPPDSTAVNGVHQHLQQHVFRNVHPAPHVLPPAPVFPLSSGRPYSGAPIDVLNYHYDNYPTGWNQSETDLTPGAVRSKNFGVLTVLNVKGNVLAEPLVVSNFQMPDGSTHDVLIVATGHNVVYAFDAKTYSQLWKASMGTPQSSGDVGCSDIVPEYGISSTPVIVRHSASSATIYLVAASEPAPFSFHTQVHALDLGTGKDAIKPREIAPTATLSNGAGTLHFDPQNQWNRSSLVYANGNIYMGIGSHCDNNAGAISGWVLSYDASTLQSNGKFNTIEAAAGYELASVWMSGYAVAVNSTGNILAVTGNGNFNTGAGMKGYGESVISLQSNLKLHSYFTPADYQDLNNGDTDFGSGGVMVIPKQPGQTVPEMALAAGKEGTLFLLNASTLGGVQDNDAGALQKLSVGDCWCGPAFYVGPKGPTVFFQGSYDGLHAYRVSTTGTPQLTQIAQGTSGADFGGSFPVVSSNGQVANSGVVWLIRHGDTMQLEAYNAELLGDPLFAANAGQWSNGSRGYLSPTVANGRVYVPAYKTVTVFGLAK
ncbi:MAG TPA: hypothetical protein VGG10_21895 [Rhizomicrobium sp.]|jgi:hypothetical protein